MRGRLLTAAVAATLITTPALAAPSKTCATITDEDRPGEPSSLDIRRVAVAVGTKTVVVRLTLDTTDSSRDPARVLGYRWAVGFTTARRSYEVAYQRPVGPADTYRGTFGGRSHRTAVSRTAITWTLDRSALPGLDRKKGATTCAVTATTQVAALTADDAG